MVRAQVAAIAADNAEAKGKKKEKEEEKEKEKEKDTAVEVLSEGGATAKQTSEIPGGQAQYSGKLGTVVIGWNTLRY